MTFVVRSFSARQMPTFCNLQLNKMLYLKGNLLILIVLQVCGSVTKNGEVQNVKCDCRYMQWPGYIIVAVTSHAAII